MQMSAMHDVSMVTDLVHDIEWDVHPLGWRKASLWV